MDDIDRDRLDQKLKNIKTTRERSDPWIFFTEAEFRLRYRLSKGSFYKLTECMEEELSSLTNRLVPIQISVVVFAEKVI